MIIETKNRQIMNISSQLFDVSMELLEREKKIKRRRSSNVSKMKKAYKIDGYAKWTSKNGKKFKRLYKDTNK